MTDHSAEAGSRLTRSLRRVVGALGGVALAACLGGRLLAQTVSPQTAPPVSPDALHSPARDVTISLLTMGNGTKVWEMFGHSAIWIRDDATGRDTVFNWGVFDSTKPNFILHFLKGLMLYQMGGGDIAEIRAEYTYFNRSVVAQDLELTTAQKDSLLILIQRNAQPENITYRYDYFRDNCSTRPRDLLDAVLGGQVHDHARQVMPTSYRWHALRLMQGDKPLVVGVDIGLGEPSDRPITKWDELFLPRELHDLLTTIQVRDSTGAARPLVRAERPIVVVNRPPEAEAPPNLAPWLFVIGMVVAGLFGWIGTRATTGHRAARVVAAFLFSAWSLVAGLLGVVLSILWVATDHAFAHANENLLLFNPIWLLLVVLLPLALLTGRAARATQRTVILVTALVGVGLLAHLVHLSSQSNLALVGLALPPALAIWWVARGLTSSR